MNYLHVLAGTVPPTDPGLKPGLDETQVTPGTIGFLFTLFLTIAVILLIMDMSRRVRRVRYRAQAQGETLEQPFRGTDVDGGTFDPRAARGGRGASAAGGKSVPGTNSGGEAGDGPAEPRGGRPGAGN